MSDPRHARRRLRTPSPSMAVSLLALFVALAGTATAATLIRSSGQIRDGVVTSADLRNGTIQGKDVRNGRIGTKDLRDGSVSSEDLADGTVRSEDLAPSARPGSGDGTQALEAFRRSGPDGVSAGEPARVATLRDMPAGTYAVFAKTVLTATPGTEGLLRQGQTISGHCVLEVAGEQDHSRALLGGPGANSPGQIHTQLTRGLEGPGEAALTCDVQDTPWRASDTTIIAVRVGAAPRQEVQD